MKQSWSLDVILTHQKKGHLTHLVHISVLCGLGKKIHTNAFPEMAEQYNLKPEQHNLKYGIK